MFIESGIVSEGSIKGVLSGKHYNRSVLCHKTMYEALQRLRFEAFLDTLDDEYQESIFSLIETMQDSFTEGKFQECMKGQLFDDIIIKYEAFVAESSTKSKTFAYWSMYTKMAGKNVFNSSRFTGLLHACKVNIIYFLTQPEDMLEPQIMFLRRYTSDVHSSNKAS